MKKFNEILREETTSQDIPETVVNAWKKMIDYDMKMKQKFSYFDVTFKSKNLTTGHKGHMTKTNNEFEKLMKDFDLDPNQTVKRLMNLYPPKYI